MLTSLHPLQLRSRARRAAVLRLPALLLLLLLAGCSLFDPGAEDDPAAAGAALATADRAAFEAAATAEALNAARATLIPQLQEALLG